MDRTRRDGVMRELDSPAERPGSTTLGARQGFVFGDFGAGAPLSLAKAKALAGPALVLRAQQFSCSLPLAIQPTWLKWPSVEARPQLPTFSPLRRFGEGEGSQTLGEVSRTTGSPVFTAYENARAVSQSRNEDDRACNSTSLNRGLVARLTSEMWRPTM